MPVEHEWDRKATIEDQQQRQRKEICMLFAVVDEIRGELSQYFATLDRKINWLKIWLQKISVNLPHSYDRDRPKYGKVNGHKNSSHEGNESGWSQIIQNSHSFKTSRYEEDRIEL